ncbi:MAG: hypothetical protein JXB00_02815 [Bacteroidales bacterium]|nr:hypothetical protein [Bacteroidales bacterium]
MERKKYIITIILLGAFSALYASHQSDIYSAYIDGDMVKWKKTIDAMHLKKEKSSAFILELLNYEYGFIGWCMGNDKYSLAKEYLRRGETNIEILEQRKYQPSILNAYKSAFYGFKIGLSKIQAPFLGPKSLSHARHAIEIDPKNPFGYVQYANAMFYMPETFGGSKTIALENYKKAQKLYEAVREANKYDWNYLALLITIANACKEMNRKTEAKTYYELILKTEPKFQWVKNELYPELLKQMK